MWNSIADHSALVLGLVISAHTIYSFVEKRLTNRRQRYALLRNLRLRSEYFIALARSLSQRAEQAVKLYASYVASASLLDPAAEPDSLPEGAERTTQWLVGRAEHLLDYQISVEMEKIGGMLSKAQVECLLIFLTRHRSYTEVLATRMVDLRMFPRKAMVLRRFAAVTAIDIDSLNKLLHAFGRSLGFEDVVSEPHTETSSEAESA